MGRNKNDHSTNRSQSQSQVENEPDKNINIPDSAHAIYESTLTAFMTATNKRIDDFHVTILTNQERRLTEIRAEAMAEIADLKANISELRSSVSFALDEVTTIKTQVAETAPAVDSVAAERIDRIERQLTEHTLQIDYLENQSRRNNVRIDGITEDRGETWDSTESKCRSLFTNTLGLPQVTIERAHRTGPLRQGNRNPRSIVVKLSSYKHREAILKRTKERKPKGIFINEDFSARVSRARKELRPMVQDLKRKGMDVHLSYDKIRYRGKDLNPTEISHLLRVDNIDPQFIDPGRQRNPQREQAPPQMHSQSQLPWPANTPPTDQAAQPQTEAGEATTLKQHSGESSLPLACNIQADPPFPRQPSPDTSLKQPGMDSHTPNSTTLTDIDAHTNAETYKTSPHSTLKAPETANL